MLGVGRLIQRDCGRVTRRELLQAGALGALGLSLSDLLRIEATGAPRESAGGSGEARGARNVILLWLWGGPSHIDTFDLKPHAPLEYRGPYRPIATSVPGIAICELLPQLAQRAQRYCLIRSMEHESNDHGIAGTISLTGTIAGAKSLSGQLLPGVVRPTHGSIVSKVEGFEPRMPRFVTLGGRLHQGKTPINGEGGGSLGSLHDPFRLDYDPEEGVKIPQLRLVDGMTADGMSSRRGLLRALDRVRANVESSKPLERYDQFASQAFSLLVSPKSREVFDLDREAESLRTRYGRFRFGQCCLMVRRLVESGARFVQVNWSSHVEPIEDTGDGGWDMHDRYFQQYQDRHSWMFDQAASALLDDLADRGLLSETIVVAIGEFGRTPRINVKAGRDHWNHCYSALIAGGGLRTAQVVGSSDKNGEHPASRPTTPADLFATVLDRIGVGTTRLTASGITPLGRIVEEIC